MRSLLATLIILLTISSGDKKSITKPTIDIAKTRAKAAEAKQLCLKRSYNTRYCILIDMSLPSGVNRFLVWDFKRDTVLLTGLVSHGCGDMPWSGMWSKDKPKFSSVNGSHCTALGKYLVGARGYSQWGIHVKYFLSGLEASTKNAMARQIVLHSWSDIAEQEVYPNGTPEGWGCPAVADGLMKQLDALFKKQGKRTLLWIYT